MDTYNANVFMLDNTKLNNEEFIRINKTLLVETGNAVSDTWEETMHNTYKSNKDKKEVEFLIIEAQDCVNFKQLTQLFKIQFPHLIISERHAKVKPQGDLFTEIKPNRDWIVLK